MGDENGESLAQAGTDPLIKWLNPKLREAEDAFRRFSKEQYHKYKENDLLHHEDRARILLKEFSGNFGSVSIYTISKIRELETTQNIIEIARQKVNNSAKIIAHEIVSVSISICDDPSLGDRFIQETIQETQNLRLAIDNSFSKLIMRNSDAAAFGSEINRRRTKSKPKRPGRRLGSGSMEQADRVLLVKMHKLITEDNVASPHMAASMVASEAMGGGSLESKIARLAKRYRQSEFNS